MSYSTVSNTYHIWLCSIATDKVLVEKQEENDILQEKIQCLEKEVRLQRKDLANKDQEIMDLKSSLEGDLEYYILSLSVEINIVRKIFINIYPHYLLMYLM